MLLSSDEFIMIECISYFERFEVRINFIIELCYDYTCAPPGPE